MLAKWLKISQELTGRGYEEQGCKRKNGYRINEKRQR